MTDAAHVDANLDQELKEAYFTAGQGQLIWARFKKQKAAMVGAGVLIWLILSGIFARVALAVKAMENSAGVPSDLLLEKAAHAFQDAIPCRAA